MSRLTKNDARRMAPAPGVKPADPPATPPPAVPKEPRESALEKRLALIERALADHGGSFAQLYRRYSK